MNFEDNIEDTHKGISGGYIIPVTGWYQSSLEIKPKYYEKGDRVDLDNVKYFIRTK